MKTIANISAILALAFLILSAAVFLSSKRAIYYADELFGQGHAVLFRDYPPTGIIFSSLGVWYISSTVSDDGFPCTMTQILGAEVGDYDAQGNYVKTPTPCFVRPVRANPEKFQGWIMFRGHLRKFCGALYGPPPASCMYKP